MSGTRYIHAEKLLRFDPKVHVSYCNLWEYSYHPEAPLVFLQYKTLFISNRLLLTLLAHWTKGHESILTQNMVNYPLKLGGTMNCYFVGMMYGIPCTKFPYSMPIV